MHVLCVLYMYMHVDLRYNTLHIVVHVHLVLFILLCSTCSSANRHSDPDENFYTNFESISKTNTARDTVVPTLAEQE